jgi:hypothetical protein
MTVFTFQKTPRPNMIVSNSRPIRNPFAGLAGLFPTSSGRCSRAASPSSSGHSVYSASPRLALSRRLIRRHSTPIPPYIFDVSLPPTPPSAFSIWSLLTPRLGSDYRRLDVMDRGHRRCVCPAIDAVRYRTVWSCPDELREIGRCHCRRFLPAVIHRGERGSGGL